MNKERYRIRFSMKAEGEEAEVLVYSEIANDKWWGDETTPGDFDKALKEARKNGASKLNVRINSGGGEVYAAVAMRSMIINAGFESVRVMIEGLCASAATLFATVPGAHVVIAEGSEFMIHNPMTITWGNAEEIMKTVDHLHKMEEQFHGMYAAKTGQSEDTIKDWMDAETWFTAKEACDCGFCDELLASEPVAACVTAQEMGVMKAIYKAVPEGIMVRDDEEIAAAGTSSVSATGAATFPNGEGLNVSHEAPVAGASTEINHEEEHDTMDTMDIKDLNMDQLRADNPALLEQIQREALEADRQRREDIDAITPPVADYQKMAEDAKKNGTPFTDYQRQLVAAMKQKGTDYQEARKQELNAAKQVAGDAAEAEGKSDEQKILENAKEIAAYAEEFSGSNNESMF